MVIGIDVGYGYTKIVASNGNGDGKIKTMFPSRVSRYIPKKSFKESFEVIRVNGKPFIVGSDVEGASKVGLDFVGTDEYFAIVGHSLTKIGAAKRTMVLGLPPQAFEESKIQYLRDELRRMDVRLEDGTKVYVPSTIEFVPQGAGIFFAHLGDSRDYCGSSAVAVVDIGYHTMDIVLFADEAYKASMSKSYPLGVNALYSMVRDAYIKKYSIFLSADNDTIVERLLKYGKIPHLGEEHTLNTEEILNTFYIGKVSKSLMDYISDSKEHGYMIDRIILGGGGIAYIGEVSGATVVSDPQFANANGYLTYGLQLR